MPRAHLAVLLSSLLCGACASHEDRREGKSEPPPPTPTHNVADDLTVSVASVQLQNDCPPPQAAAKREAAMEPPADEALGDSDRGFEPPCVQSRLQLAIASKAKDTVAFSVRTVRLKKADGGDVLGTMQVREPMRWQDNGFEPWDQQVAAEASLKVGYALGDPDWRAVEKALGGSSWGRLYVIEVEVEVAGVVRTVVSPKVPRDEPEIMVT